MPEHRTPKLSKIFSSEQVMCIEWQTRSPAMPSIQYVQVNLDRDYWAYNTDTKNSLGSCCGTKGGMSADALVPNARIV